ncbi:MAG: hypothetical protein ACI9E1_000475 [Cryomorphaceae bacterium]|jgi:hypothetical protein
MSFSKHPRLLVIIIAITSITNAIVSAKFEQKMLSVNKSDKKVTFTFYHFDSSKTATLTDVAENVANTAAQQNSKAAISASAKANFSYQSGKFVFPSATSYFIKNGNISSPAKSLRSSKHTFILTDNKGRHAICYSPSVSETELGYALQQYFTATKTKFTTAVIIDSGNQCGFYKTNGKYRPYYLKELKKPAKTLLVK